MQAARVAHGLHIPYKSWVTNAGLRVLWVTGACLDHRPDAMTEVVASPVPATAVVVRTRAPASKAIFPVTAAAAAAALAPSCPHTPLHEQLALHTHPGTVLPIVATVHLVSLLSVGPCFSTVAPTGGGPFSCHTPDRIVTIWGVRGVLVWFGSFGSVGG